MNDHNRLKQKALDLFNTADGIAGDDTTLRDRLRDARDRLGAGRLTLVVCGEWRRGKSSLINMLLDEPGLCPTGSDVTTAVVTLIQYAEVPRYTVFVGEPGHEVAETLTTRSEIEQYVSERHNPGNAKLARLVLVELPNAKLRDGLVVVDTPGVGGALARHTEVTYKFVPRADAVLFVTDPSALTVPELDFVKLVDQHCKSIVFAVTKIDGDAGLKAGPVLDGNRRKLAAALGIPLEDVELVPVSSTLKQDYLASGDERDLADSGFPVLERELWRRFGANRGRILLLSALVKLDAALMDLRGPLAAELQAVTERDGRKLDGMKAEQETAARRLGELQEQGAAWRGQLADGLAGVRRAADQALSAAFRDIRRRSDKYLKNEGLLRASEQIPGLLETDIDALLADVQAGMERGAGEVYAGLEVATGLALNRADVGELVVDAPEFRFDPAAVARTGRADKVMTVGREVMLNAGGGATIFGLFGGLLGGIAGGLAGIAGGPLGVIAGAAFGGKVGAGLGGAGGLVAGKAYGLRKSFRVIDQADQAAVTQKLVPEVRHFIEDCEAAAKAALGGVQAALAEAVKDELSARLRDERRRAEEVITRIKQARARSTAENAARVPVLRGSVARIDAARREATALVADANRAGTTAGPGETVPARVGQPAPAAAADSGDWADD